MISRLERLGKVRFLKERLDGAESVTELTVALTSVPSMAVTLVSGTSRLGTASTSGPVFWLTSPTVVWIALASVSVPVRSRVLLTE